MPLWFNENAATVGPRTRPHTKDEPEPDLKPDKTNIPIKALNPAAGLAISGNWRALARPCRWNVQNT
jgi:hypothetical protein